jgi:hypothetical protein
MAKHVGAWDVPGPAERVENHVDAVVVAIIETLKKVEAGRFRRGYPLL